MNALQNILTVVLMTSGTFFMMTGSIGIVRLPDFFARLHAASKSDTLGIILFTAGMIVYNGMNMDSLKLLVIFILTALTNPVGSHALTRAAFNMGVKPWFRKEEKGKP
jgi:multicomponent Na+:H+ antiporter subunit G